MMGQNHGMGAGMGIGMPVLVLIILLIGIAVGFLVAKTSTKPRSIVVLVLLAIGAIVVWRFFMQPNHMTNTANRSENTAEAMVEVQVPQLTGLAATGEGIFNENCSACHGVNAAGREGIGPPLVHIIYETSHHGDAAFYLAVKNGVRAHHWPFGNMPAVEGVSEDDIAAIVAYVRTLQRANGIN